MASRLAAGSFAMADFEHVFQSPPEGAAADWTISQNWRAYTQV